MDKVINLFAKILTCLILRADIRKKVRTNILTKWYGRDIFKNAKYIGNNLCVRGYSAVNRNTSLGSNVLLNGLEIHGNGNVKIGNFVRTGIDCLIITQNHNYEGSTIPYGTDYIYKEVLIEDFVWLGSRVMILPGTKIGEGAIIQGGAVVHGEIPPYSICGGNPAKVFKFRNEKHFKELKSKGKFIQSLM